MKCTRCGRTGHTVSTCAYVAAPSTRAPRTCSRCGARGHDVRSCTLTPPSADALLATAEDRDEDDLDELDAAERATEAEADASAWDPDELPTAPPATTVPAPKHRARPRLVVEKASPASSPAPLRVLLFASADGGVTVEAHEIATDPTQAAEIIDAWDKPAVLARGRRLVHVSPRVPTGLVIAAVRHLRGAA